MDVSLDEPKSNWNFTFFHSEVNWSVIGQKRFKTKFCKKQPEYRKSINEKAVCNIWLEWLLRTDMTVTHALKRVHWSNVIGYPFCSVSKVKLNKTHIKPWFWWNFYFIIMLGSCYYVRNTMSLNDHL